MSVPLALLGLLDREPSYGEPGAGPDRKRYAITSLGKQEVAEWLADHGLFHLEADLRWIDVTSARPAALAETVRPS
jgi:DNA-binding PadR family transcriptional regulator